MKTFAVAVAAGLSLSACVTINAPITSTGSDNNEAVTQYPIETAFLNIYTKERRDTLVAMVGSQQISADITVTPKGTMTFDSKQVQAAEVSTISKIDARITSETMSTNYYTLNPLIFHGYTDRSGEYSVSTPLNTIPKMATPSADQSYPLLTENVYSDSSKTQKTALYRQNWSLTSDSRNSAWLCIDNSANLLSISPDGSTSECYRINVKGDILSSKVSINVPSNASIKTITLVNQ